MYKSILVLAGIFATPMVVQAQSLTHSQPGPTSPLPLSAAASQDKDIWDALVNVTAVALPTAYPIAGWDKQVGRLHCRHLFNSVTQLDTYTCAETLQDKDIWDALVNVTAVALPTAYPIAGWDKRVGRLHCRHLFNTVTKTDKYTCNL
jgi:hypothetical protein